MPKLAKIQMLQREVTANGKTRFGVRYPVGLNTQRFLNSNVIRRTLRKDAFSVSEKQFKECNKMTLNGDTRAQDLIGICYEDGLGVIKNKTEAYAYYKLASASIAAAEQKLSKLEKSINFEVYILGQNRAKELQKDITAKGQKK